MSETSTTNFSLTQSGSPIVISNTTADSASVTIVYTLDGSGSFTLSVESLSNANGATLLDSVSTTTSTSRTVQLNGASMDGFRITGTWSGPGSVACVLSSSGLGKPFDSTLLSAVQTYSA
ncbi:MAG: hypothetical protein ABR973_06200 [Candidatus Acidiferrales bacterium]|jgi:hypothetical protein